MTGAGRRSATSTPRLDIGVMYAGALRRLGIEVSFLPRVDSRELVRRDEDAAAPRDPLRAVRDAPPREPGESRGAEDPREPPETCRIPSPEPVEAEPAEARCAPAGRRRRERERQARACVHAATTTVGRC